MKIKINGNTITVVSELNFDILKDIGKTIVKNDNDKILYGCAVGELSSISEFGAVFNFKTHEGKAALNIISDCLDQDLLSKEFIKSHQIALENLMKYENAIAEIMQFKYNTRNDLLGMIEIE